MSNAITVDIECVARARDPQRNRLLALLPIDDRMRLRPHLDPVTLHAGEVLCGQSARYLYFPTTAIVSLLYVTQSRAADEIAVIGADGVVGLSVGGDSQPLQSRVQADGHAFRLRARPARPVHAHDTGANHASGCLQSPSHDRATAVPPPLAR